MTITKNFISFVHDAITKKNTTTFSNHKEGFVKISAWDDDKNILSITLDKDEIEALKKFINEAR